MLWPGVMVVKNRMVNDRGCHSENGNLELVTRIVILMRLLQKGHVKFLGRRYADIAQMLAPITFLSVRPLRRRL